MRFTKPFYFLDYIVKHHHQFLDYIPFWQRIYSLYYRVWFVVIYWPLRSLFNFAFIAIFLHSKNNFYSVHFPPNSTLISLILCCSRGAHTWKRDDLLPWRVNYTLVNNLNCHQSIIFLASFFESRYFLSFVYTFNKIWEKYAEFQRITPTYLHEFYTNNVDSNEVTYINSRHICNFFKTSHISRYDKSLKLGGLKLIGAVKSVSAHEYLTKEHFYR